MKRSTRTADARHGFPLTERLNICARAKLSGMMERRKLAGQTTIIPAVAKAVLWAIVNRGDDYGTAYPSIVTIATEADASVRTVDRVVQILREEQIVTVTTRCSAIGAGKGSQDRSGSTNEYCVDFERLRSLESGKVRKRWDRREGDRPQSEEPDSQVESARQPDVRSECDGSTERTPASQGAHASPARSARQPVEERTPVLRALKEEPPIEPPMNPPQPPKGERGGGEERAVQQADHATLREQAQAIVDAYPPTSSDLPEADRKAAIDAILGEAEQPERCTWQEIRDAAVALRLARPKDPRWARNWLKLRGYLPLVLEARRRAQAPCEEPGESRYERAEREMRERRERIAATDAALAALTAEELQAEHAALLAETTAPMVRQWLGQGDWRSNRFVREQIADRLARKGLVTA